MRENIVYGVKDRTSDTGSFIEIHLYEDGLLRVYWVSNKHAVSYFFTMKDMDEYEQYQSKLKSDQEAYEQRYGGEKSTVYNTRNYYIFESTWRKASNTPITDASRLISTNTIDVVNDIIDETGKQQVNQNGIIKYSDS